MAKPEIIPVWAIGPTADKIEPTSTQEDVGYTPRDYPKHEEFNYLFNTYYQWIKYINDELSVQIEDTDTISKTFVYLDDTTYNSITNPTTDNKINKKVSEAVDLVRGEHAFGDISGCSVECSVDAVTVSSGLLRLYKNGSTQWYLADTLIRSIQTLSNKPVINLGHTDWSYWDAGGFMANSVTTFGSGVSVYFFILSEGSNDFLFADTSRSGINAVNTLSSVNSIPLNDIYLRRIGSTITRTSSGTTIIMPTRSVDDNVFALKLVENDIDAYNSHIYIDTLGLLIPATSPMTPGGSSASGPLTTLALAPSLNETIYKCSVRYGGTATNVHDVVVDIDDDNSTRYNYSNYHHLTYSLSTYIKNVSREAFELTSDNFAISNTSTTASAGGDILYLELICHGWTDYREKNFIG
ncbi:MAG: hypothetical protein CMI54_07855 [Parcubacteria group bacterium]|jgi:hypothetical protein|nr:hypothetical protein [Parcubacteria group bacterium]|tara:strand:+ start:3617 stop:4846 length:1230 start_codon:yes stop_codon:yes gene_type:complete